MSIPDPWSIGRCADCRKKRELYREKCHTCRHPWNQRPMIEAGIPCGSSGALANIMRKAKGKSKSAAMALVSLIYPVLMENLTISAGWRLIVKNRKYVWHRIGGWGPA